MKKFTSALLAVTALTAANAFAAGAVDSKTGAYVGGNVGMANTNVKYGFTAQNVTASASFSTDDRKVNFKSNTGKMNPLFGLFAGYGMQVGSMYFGGEVYGGFDSAKVVSYDDSATGKSSGYWKSSVKRTNFYGIAPRLGFFLTPSTMMYVKLGIEGGKWKATIDPNFATIDASGSAVYGASAATNAANAPKSKKQFNSSKNAISFVPGLGLDAFVTKNLFVRAEYSYMFGPKVTVTQDTSGYDNSIAPGSTYVHTFNITQQTFKVGVGYKF